MGDWGFAGADASFVPNYKAASTYLASANTGTEDTKTGYVEVIASTPFDCFLCLKTAPADVATDFLYDVAIGGAGSEVVIFSNIFANLGAGTSTGGFYGMHDVIPVIPILVPKGSRVSFRVQKHFGSGATKYCDIAVDMIPKGSMSSSFSYAVLTTYGANTGDSGGVSVDPHASANTAGAWTEITASCVFPVRALFFAVGGQRNASRTDVTLWKVDIGVGAEGSEVVIIDGISLHHRVYARKVTPVYSNMYPVSIPIGTRISVRLWCNQTAQKTLDVVLYCLT